MVLKSNQGDVTAAFLHAVNMKRSTPICKEYLISIRRMDIRSV